MSLDIVQTNQGNLFARKEATTVASDPGPTKLYRTANTDQYVLRVGEFSFKEVDKQEAFEFCCKNNVKNYKKVEDEFPELIKKANLL